MKKVEVYFLINLGAILSLFAIEGELAKYKRKQGDILLEVAKDKLEAMVDVNNINSLNSDSLYKFTFDLEGEYDKESVDVTAEFNLNDTTALNDELNLTAKAVMKEGSYVAEIPISQFETFQNKRFDVSLDIGFLPNISSSTIDDWTVIFGSDNIAKKIEDNINKKVSRDGAFRMTRDLDAAIVPVPLEGQKADFFVLFDKKRFTVLKGLKWEIPLTVGGVFSNSDFEVSISGGNEMISSIVQGTPRSKIIGNATSSGGNIEITGIRKKDSKVSTTSSRIVVIEPEWATTPDMVEIYTNEKYNFDLSVKSLSRDRISVNVIENNGKPKLFNRSVVSVGPYKKPGTLEFRTLIDGESLKDLVHKVKIRNLPEPLLSFKRKPGTNDLTLEIITYGKNNGIDKVFPIGGISGKVVETDTEKFSNRKITRYRLTIARPSSGIIQTVKLKVKDKYNLMSESDNEFEYFK